MPNPRPGLIRQVMAFKLAQPDEDRVAKMHDFRTASTLANETRFCETFSITPFSDKPTSRPSNRQRQRRSRKALGLFPSRRRCRSWGSSVNTRAFMGSNPPAVASGVRRRHPRVSGKRLCRSAIGTRQCRHRPTGFVLPRVDRAPFLQTLSTAGCLALLWTVLETLLSVIAYRAAVCTHQFLILADLYQTRWEPCSLNRA